jgi:hypothetical protein
MVITQCPQEILGIENVWCSMAVPFFAVDPGKIFDPGLQW